MNTGNITGTLVITLVMLVVIFLIFREVVCWYWKINRNLTVLTEIRDLLASSKTGAANAPAVTIASPAVATPNAVSIKAERNRATVQRLAEHVRDNPRLPVDEKIELLQRLGGQFSWEEGSACKVSYRGRELTFPGGKEFGDWLSASVLPEVLRSADSVEGDHMAKEAAEGARTHAESAAVQRRAAAQVQAAVPAAAPTATADCPICSTPVTPDDLFCAGCGHKLK